MKNFFYLLVLFISIISCKSKIDNEIEGITNIESSNSVKGIIYNKIKNDVEQAKKSDGVYSSHKFNQNGKEILESIKIVEEIEIPKTDLILVFYHFYVGTDIIRNTEFVKKEENNYYLVYKYFSSYDDDPFRNGEPEKGKELLKKLDGWKEGNKDIYWLDYY
jgi:hypothetical protein